jgi:threonine dehydrogenase-like Zn-dependent dehydrogenase
MSYDYERLNWLPGETGIKVGVCSLCGGEVHMKNNYSPVFPTPLRCTSCGAIHSNEPVINMKRNS